jgi:hypothetical protein
VQGGWPRVKPVIGRPAQGGQCQGRDGNGAGDTGSGRRRGGQCGVGGVGAVSAMGQVASGRAGDGGDLGAGWLWWGGVGNRVDDARPGSTENQADGDSMRR